MRELRNVVERLMIMVPGDRHRRSAISRSWMGWPRARRRARVVPLHEARDQFERDYILRALAAQQGNISRTAEVLGVERSNLYRKMRGFGIAPVRRVDGEEETALLPSPVGLGIQRAEAVLPDPEVQAVRPNPNGFKHFGHSLGAGGADRALRAWTDSLSRGVAAHAFDVRAWGSEEMFGPPSFCDDSQFPGGSA